MSGRRAFAAKPCAGQSPSILADVADLIPIVIRPDPGVVLGDGAGDQLELPGDELDPQGIGVEQRGFIGQGDGLGDPFQAPGDEGLTAGALEVVEPFKGGGLGWRIDDTLRAAISQSMFREITPCLLTSRASQRWETAPVAVER